MPRKGEGKVPEEQREKRERWQQYYRNNKTEILEKGKEYNKEYRQLEAFCDFCPCKVKKCRWSKHLQTKKHKHNETVKKDEEEKVNKMTDEE